MARGAVEVTLPAPTGGWNAKDSVHELAALGAPDALVMENIFPGNGVVSLRRGYRVHAFPNISGNPVETLAELAGPTGTRTLIAGSGTALYNVSNYSTSQYITGAFTNVRFQTQVFNHRLFFVNGADAPRSWDGTTMTTPAFTGSGLTVANLSNVSAYRERLYFLEKNTANIWFGGVQAVSGALTKWDLSYTLKMGGYPVFAGSWTRDSGSGAVDYFVVVTDTGETLVYEGTFPGTGGIWELRGRFVLPKPLGSRAFAGVGADLAIITEQGVIPLSDVLNSRNDTLTEYSKLTDRIGPIFRDAAKNYGSNFGWQAMVYPRGPYILFNVPIAPGSQSHQYVINSETKSWCKFTGMNASSWCTLNGKPYFGGVDGKVYEADYGYDDNGSYIPVKLTTAYNYAGAQDQVKHFLRARPTVTGDSSTSYRFAVLADFNDRILTDRIVPVDGSLGSTWDTATWDTATWDTQGAFSRAWYSASGYGACAAIKLDGSFRNAPWSISNFSLAYEPVRT